MAAVTVHGDFEAQENKVCHFPIVSPFICHEVMGPDVLNPDLLAEEFVLQNLNSYP